MKVVLVTPYYTLSMQRKVVHLALSGIEICQVIPQTYYGQLNPVLRQNASIANLVSVPVNLVRPFDPHRAMIVSTLAWLKDFRPDLIAVEWDPDTLMAAQAALARGLWSRRSKLLLHSWQNVARPLSLPVRLVLRYTLQAADGICCTNRAGVTLLQNLGYKGQLFYQPWLGVDTSIFYRRERETLRRSLGLDGFVVGYVGRLSPEKGVADLIKAMARLPDDIECVLIGDGPDKTDLGRLAALEGVAGRVHLLDQIANESLAQYFSILDVLVLPSRTTAVWKEQYGRVLLEAMACKVPIVGSDCGAIPEVVGQAGLIFPEGDVERLADRIRAFYQNPELGLEYGQLGYAQVVEKYSQEMIATQVAQVFQRVIEGRTLS